MGMHLRHEGNTVDMCVCVYIYVGIEAYHSGRPV
jgi:hypothetical protein